MHSPAVSIEDVLAAHQIRIGWQRPTAGELQVQAQAWSRSIPGLQALPLAAALWGLEGWPQIGEVRERLMATRGGALPLPGRPATLADLEGWPATLARLAAPPEWPLMSNAAYAAHQRRVSEVEVWVRRLPVRLEQHALLLDAAALQAHLAEAIPALMLGVPVHGLSLHLSLADIQREAGCALALRYARPSTARLAG